MSSSATGPEFNPFSTPNVVETTTDYQPSVPLEGYSTVRIGLKLIYYSIAAMALGLILMVVLGLGTGMMSGAGGPGPAEIGFLGVMMLGGVTMIVASIAAFVGYCMCLACPRSNEKPLAVTSLVAFLIYFALSFFDGIYSTMNMGGAAWTSMVFPLLSNLAFIVSSVAFCLLMKRIGNNVSSDSLVKASKSALTWFCTMMGVGIGGATLMFLLAFTSGGQASVRDSIWGYFAVFAVAMVVLGLGTLFQYLSMLRNGIDALDPKKHVQA